MPNSLLRGSLIGRLMDEPLFQHLLMCAFGIVWCSLAWGFTHVGGLMSAFRLMRRDGHKTLRRLYSGPLGVYMDRIAAWYIDHGYARGYAVAALKSADRFGRWVER